MRVDLSALEVRKSRHLIERALEDPFVAAINEGPIATKAYLDQLTITQAVAVELLKKLAIMVSWMWSRKGARN